VGYIEELGYSVMKEGMP